MRSLDSLAARSVFLLVLCGFDFALLLGGYGMLRVLRLPVNGFTRIIGGLIIALSLSICLLMALHAQASRWPGAASKVVGALSFLVAVYAASQWPMRRWYVGIKQQASRWLLRPARDFLVFLRRQHLFFGWVVAAGAFGHMIFFVPTLARIAVYEEVTGWIALGILALMVLLGLWLWFVTAVRKQRLPRGVRVVHSALAMAFFLALFLHI
ncbi:MAG TPA: hypothetical protein VGF67_17935 [Ktedonobacteraceae bacterium]|jgi:hypothetical protein